MVTEAGKELLRNTINTAKFHNRILEENEMWKQWELECGLTMMVSDDDIIKRIKKNHQCSKHRRRDKSRSRDRSRNKCETTKARKGAGSSNDRWDHSGFAELYPDASVPDKQPSTSSSTLNKHKKKKKSRHKSNSSDEEIWEEFKRPIEIWNKENTLRLIELLSNAPALWNKNYRGYGDLNVKLREIERIASKLKLPEEEIMSQVAFLMNEFHKEHDKINGVGSNLSENEWYFYKHLTFLKNERKFKTIEGSRSKPIFVDSSDSYSESEDEIIFLESRNKSSCVNSKVQNEEGNCRNKASSTSTDLPYVQAYKDKKDSFTIYGEIVAHRIRESKKSTKAVSRAEIEIDTVLRKLEGGFFDMPEDTFK